MPLTIREITLQTFSPREVQSRVRAGASAQDVADATGWPLDKVLRYAEPLLAERAFIAEQAMHVEVRRTPGGVSLRETASAALGLPTETDDIVWDARRRDDGKWIVTASYTERKALRTAEWTYDHAGRNIHPLDDQARALMGVRAPSSDRDDIAEALDLVAEALPEPTDARPRLVAVPDSDSDEPPATDDDASADPVDLPPAAQSAEPKPRPSIIDGPRPQKPAKPKSRKGRAHVPSWDEILFGASRPDEPS